MRVFFLLIAVIVLAGSARADPPPASPGRLVVKYRAGFEACVDCLLAKGIRFRTATGNDALDQLHTELGVRAARPLFARARAARWAGATAADDQRTQRARFPPGP